MISISISTTYSAPNTNTNNKLIYFPQQLVLMTKSGVVMVRAYQIPHVVITYLIVPMALMNKIVPYAPHINIAAITAIALTKIVAVMVSTTALMVAMNTDAVSGHIIVISTVIG